MARGNVVHVMGDELEMCAFEENLDKLQKHILKYNSLTEEEILQILKGEKTNKEGVEGVIVYSVTGRPITARSINQQELVKAYQENDMIFAVGPAGSGKTYTS
ncbi:MAG: PhoH family protein, partial [Treponema sp.]|nr:PhoH family protein [Treponema sp.]